MTSLLIWINLFLIASTSLVSRGGHASQANMTGARTPAVAKDPSKHHPSSAVEVLPGGVGGDRMSSVEHLIARKLDQAEGRIERRLDERIQLLNQTVTFGHMEKLLHHLNEELLQNRDQLVDQNEDLKRMTSTLALQKQELEAEKENVVIMKMALDNLTHLVNHLVEVLAANRGTIEIPEVGGAASVNGGQGLATTSHNNNNTTPSTPASQESFPTGSAKATIYAIAGGLLHLPIGLRNG